MMTGVRADVRSAPVIWWVRMRHVPPFLRELAVPRNKPCESQINGRLLFQ